MSDDAGMSKWIAGGGRTENPCGPGFAGVERSRSDNGVASDAYDPNSSHPTAGLKDDSMAFPSEAASKSAGDSLIYSPGYDPGQGSSEAEPSGLWGRTTESVDYSLPDGRAEIYSPERGLTGQTAK